jgi:ATP-dependent RNA helicase DDX10/DBP4
MKKAKQSRNQSEINNNVDEEIETLSRRIAEEAPARGFVSPLSNAVTAFSALAISKNTIRGLDDGNFVTMTAIQNACIPHALAQRDILGAARTGR